MAKHQSQTTTKKVRITVAVSPELYKRISLAATMTGISMSDLLSQLAEETLPPISSELEQQLQHFTSVFETTKKEKKQ